MNRKNTQQERGNLSREATLDICHRVLRGRRRSRKIKLSVAGVIAMFAFVGLYHFLTSVGHQARSPQLVQHEVSDGRNADESKFEIISEQELIQAVPDDIPVAIIMLDKRKQMICLESSAMEH